MENVSESKLFINKVISYEPIASSLQQCSFEATVGMNVTCKEDVQRWVAGFSKRSGTGWIVLN